MAIFVQLVNDGSSPHTRGAQHGWPSMRTPSVDHPRIRGEHFRPVEHVAPRPGSSPHTRGALARGGFGRPASRIIPAYAGSTYDFDVWCWNSWDHPRIRGEHSSQKMTQASRAGSSPHTRGALRAEPSWRPDVRIIPAYAGSTRSWISRSQPRGDHPRIRGEHAGRAAAPAGS